MMILTKTPAGQQALKERHAAALAPRIQEAVGDARYARLASALFD